MINIIILGKLLYIGIKNWIQSLSDVFWNRNFKPALCIEGYTLANFEKNTTTEIIKFGLEFITKLYPTTSILPISSNKSPNFV